ncbi:MAG: tRNA (N6-threonylcarbamoyladenosine(37)-N6)-methyltransferase TrmO [Eubacteriales bacterium]|nr:tRNA (N6-threonylcarbamoyladenosine(37)-N6)-methyltransferase TrmO [Eubacteriales bacterium]
MIIHPIAYIKNDFSSKFGIPRQSSLVDGIHAQIIFTEEYRNPDYLRGVEEYSHLWLIWEFSKNKVVPPSPTVRPPRLGGNIRKGVFSTRSPYRPNPLGLSCVKLERVEWDSPQGPILHIEGADLLDGTPIYDIKPYLSFSDSHPDALCGWAGDAFAKTLKVVWAFEAKEPKEFVETISRLLAQDPRPSYQDDAERIYGMEYGGYDIHFRIDKETVIVLDLCKKR